MTHTCADSARSACARALAHVAVARDDRDLAGDHHVGRALDAVDQRFAAAVEVVELRLRDRVVHVDRGERQLAFLLHLVQALHAGGRLFGHALDLREARRVPARVRLELVRLIAAKSALSSSLAGLGDHASRSFSACAPRCSSSVASPPSSRIMLDVPPSGHSKMRWVYSQYSSSVSPLYANTGMPRGGDGGGGVVLRREDVARCPAHVGAERLQRLDQHRGLDRHVQRAGDARALQRLLRAYSSRIAIRPGISVSAIAISLRPQVGQRHVGDFVIGELRLGSAFMRVLSSLKARASAVAMITASLAEPYSGVATLLEAAVVPRTRRPSQRASRSGYKIQRRRQAACPQSRLPQADFHDESDQSFASALSACGLIGVSQENSGSSRPKCP